MYYRSLFSTLFIFSLLGLGLGHLDAGTRRSTHGAIWRRQLERSLDERNATLDKRFDGARLTYYDAGQNACGGYDSDNDFVVALNAPQWDNGAHCYKTITIWYGGKSTQAKVTDMCPGCPYGGLDLSRGLFGFLADLGLGVLTASWDFDGDGSPPAQLDLQAAYTPYTAYTAPTHAPSATGWTPTSTYEPTSTYSSAASFLSYSDFSTAVMAFGSYSSSSASSAGSATSTTSYATATQTPTPTLVFDQGTLNRVNLAIIGLSGLIEAANRT